MNAALATARNSIAMIFARTIAHRLVLADFDRAAPPEMTADGIAADLELLGVPVAMFMISTQPYRGMRDYPTKR